MPTMPKTSIPGYKLDRSHEAFERANRVIPGGVNSPARAFGAVGGEPPFMARAEGAYLYDIDGNQYIDYIGSGGAPIPRTAAVHVLEGWGASGGDGERVLVA